MVKDNMSMFNNRDLRPRVRRLRDEVVLENSYEQDLRLEEEVLKVIKT
jgi:hypothetical protein